MLGDVAGFDETLWFSDVNYFPALPFSIIKDIEIENSGG